MPVLTTRSQLRAALQRMASQPTQKHRLEHSRVQHDPWPHPSDDYEKRKRPADTLFTTEPTSPASMRLVVRSAMWYHIGLQGKTWPYRGAGDTDRYTPYFRKSIGGDYRIDILYISHLNVLKIQEGAPTDLSLLTSAQLWDGAAVPDMPSRGIPIAYVIILPMAESLTAKEIVDVRPIVTNITSEDVDAATWQITDDLSDQLDGIQTLFATQLPFTIGTTRVRLNGIVQQPGIAYTESGGSIALTFAPHANEVLTVGYELGEKSDYSGYGNCPWGIGLYGV